MMTALVTQTVNDDNQLLTQLDITNELGQVITTYPNDDELNETLNSLPLDRIEYESI